MARQRTAPARTAPSAPQTAAQAGDASALSEAVEIEALRTQLELVQESLTDMVIRQEDAGWSPTGQYNQNETGLTLQQLHTLIKTTRPLVASNPLIKKSISSRIGYVWADGVKFSTNSENSDKALENLIKENARYVFSLQAYEELERGLASDGNVFFLLDKTGKKIWRIPLGEISDYMTSPMSSEEIWYVQRTWSVTTRDANNRATTIEKKVWYPTVERSKMRVGTNVPEIPPKFGDVEVDKKMAVQHVLVNRQIGWPLGTPDVFSVMYWARAYKEFLEASWAITRALSKFVWKITNNKSKATNQAAVKLAQPTAGPQSFVGSDGNDLTAINRSSATPNFSAGEPLAGMVAAGLDLSVLTSLAQEKPDEGLPLTVLRAMVARQQVWDEAFTSMLSHMGVMRPEVVFRPIQVLALHRVLQAIAVAANTATLHPEEVRDLVVMTMETLGLNSDKKLPKAGKWAEYTKGMTDDKTGRQPNDNPGQTPLNTPNDGNGADPGALDDGENDASKQG